MVISRTTLAGILSLFTSACAVNAVELGVIVENDLKQPVSGAGIYGVFFDERLAGEDSADSEGVTDRSGRARISGNETLYVDLVVEKPGHYATRKRVDVRKGDVDVEVRLRAKLNPIPMFAMNLERSLPIDEAVGFDFFQGDLVAPYGLGTRSDVMLTMSVDGESLDRFSHRMSMEFPGTADGIQEPMLDPEWMHSELRTPYVAPSHGYRRDETIIFALDPEHGYERRMLNTQFVLRIRSEVDESGNSSGGHYCKISPGVSLLGGLTETPSFKMTYYCNPNSDDRNLEFDTDRNLFTNLSVRQRPRSP